MSLDQRDKAISSFTKDPNVRVFLMSLKAGGVALNLTAVSAAAPLFCSDAWSVMVMPPVPDEPEVRQCDPALDMEGDAGRVMVGPSCEKGGLHKGHSCLCCLACMP
eukprot:scaffold68413_cov21-Tisochrysis_lutea.AAC.1